jgi:hypothetical protein
MNNTLLIIGYIAVMLVAFTPTILSQRKRKKATTRVNRGFSCRRFSYYNRWTTRNIG